MITIACVKVGTKYDETYVLRLRDSVAKNLKEGHRFVCITDDHSPTLAKEVSIRYSDTSLTGWWAKLQMFQPRYWDPYGVTLYLDLDVLITRSLVPFLEYDSSFAMHRDFLKPHTPASAVMLFRGNPRPEVWERYQASPKDPNTGGVSGMYGDQDFIYQVLPAPDFFPRHWVVSYKKDARSCPPHNAKIVCFHGSPKPHEVQGGWVKEKWDESARASI